MCIRDSFDAALRAGRGLIVAAPHTVSYTHLDVYKRQGKERRFIGQRVQNLGHGGSRARRKPLLSPIAVLGKNCCAVLMPVDPGSARFQSKQSGL